MNPSKDAGQVQAAWRKGVARHGFLVHHATDPTNAATIVGPVASTKAKLGLTSGTGVSLRVAAIAPASSTGISPWSAWVVGNAR